MVQGKVRFTLASMLVCLMVAGGGVVRAATPLSPPQYAFDCSGWPVIISQPGSYVLTTNLVLPCDKDAIDIKADNVTLDLGGYSIIGLGGPGTGVGVSGVTHSNITVKNGSILKMSGNGIALGAKANVADVAVSGSKGHGIELSNGTILRVRADGNGLEGILAFSATDSSTIADSEASGNVGSGIKAGPAIISGNILKSNGSGLDCSSNCSILGNFVQNSGAIGIFCDGICTVANNTSIDNGDSGIFSTGQITNNTVTGNQGDGIHTFDAPSSVTTNSVGGNKLFGIASSAAPSAPMSFGNNQISLNNGENSATIKTKPQTSGGVQISPNICDGNTTCPGP